MPTEVALYCAASVVGTILVVFGVQRLFKQLMKPKPPKLTKDYPKDTVLLHQFGRAKYAPSLSPFPVKLETYFRMAKIPYKNMYKSAMSSKGKIPWIEYNGVDVADSQLCIEYLNKQRNVDLNKHLNDEQKAIARAFLKMVEENLYWSMVYWRWQVESGQSLVTLSDKGGFTPTMVRIITPKAKEQLFSQGMGRHEPEEVVQNTRKDAAALSKYLGNKRFLMGDTASEIDCAVFGMLAQLLWHMPGTPHEQIVTKEFPNLRDYCHRIKEELWPDWDQVILCPTAGAGAGDGDKKVQ